MATYIVWVGENEGNIIKADLIVSTLDTVLFYLNGKEIKSYDRKEFIKNNPDWVEVENIE